MNRPSYIDPRFDNGPGGRRGRGGWRWLLAVSGILAMVVILAILAAGRSGLLARLRGHGRGEGASIEELVRRLDTSLRGDLSRAGADTTLIRRDMSVTPADDDHAERRRFRWEAPVPKGFSLAAGESLFAAALKKAGGQPGEPLKARGGRQLVIGVLRPGVEVELLLMRPEPQSSDRPRLALLVDGFSQTNLADSEDLLEFGRGLTVAISPYSTGARDLADRCREKGLEVIVALPMEDYDYPRGDPGQGGILVDMNERQIRDRVDDAWDRLGGAKGAHTWMGSLAVEDRSVMRAILGEVRRREGYFVESTRSTYSTVPAVAAELEVPTARLRNNIDAGGGSLAGITANLEELAGLAQRRGSAAGVVHPRPATVQALRKLMPRWAAQGLEVVPLSELVTVPDPPAGRRND